MSNLPGKSIIVFQYYLNKMIMPYQSVGDFPVVVMMNQFNLSDWNHNDDSDLYESIDLMKDYYNIMTDRLRHRILDASSHAKI